MKLTLQGRKTLTYQWSDQGRKEGGPLGQAPWCDIEGEICEGHLHWSGQKGNGEGLQGKMMGEQRELVRNREQMPCIQGKQARKIEGGSSDVQMRLGTGSRQGPEHAGPGELC